MTALLTPSSLAQVGTGIVRVAPHGNDTPDCGSAAAPCQTLQQAVDLIPVGGTITILVAEGTYTYTGSGISQTGREVMRIAGKNVTVKGGYTLDFSRNEPENKPTIIDGQKTRRSITVEQTQDVKARLTLSGVTLTNGQAPIDGGTLNGFGGALDAFDSTVQLFDVEVVDNVAQGLPANSSNQLPGNSGGGGLSFRQSTFFLSQVELSQNKAEGGAGSGTALRGGLGVGGGIFAIESVGTINDTIIRGNVAQGGDAPGSAGLEGGQPADGLGGGLSLINSTVSQINRTMISDNLARGGAAGGKGGSGLGGGVFLEQTRGTALLQASTISTNHALGGAASANEGGGGLGGGIFSTETDLRLEAMIIIANQAQGGSGPTDGGEGGGGGIYVDSARPNLANHLQATNTIIGGNAANAGTGPTAFALGGGLFFQRPFEGASVTGSLTHVTVANNSVNNGAANAGAALFANADRGRKSTVETTFSIVANHTTASAVQANGDVVFEKTLWAGNAGKSSLGPAGSFQDNAPLQGSPDFVAPAVSPPDFHLKKTSAAIDKATGSSTTTDVDGQQRPYKPTLNNGRPDLGADEYYSPVFLTATIVDSTTLNLEWTPFEIQAVARYRLEYEVPPGANEANEGASPIDIPGNNQTSAFTLTGLSSQRLYIMTIQALSQSGAVVETSNQIAARPVDLNKIYTPLILKN